MVSRCATLTWSPSCWAPMDLSVAISSPPGAHTAGRSTRSGASAGDFTDPTVVDAALRDAPPAGRILHAVTRQRTGAIQYQMQGELLHDNARIHLNVLEAWRRRQPQAKLISLGSSCIYPESDRPIPETAFRSGLPHPSVTRLRARQGSAGDRVRDLRRTIRAALAALRAGDAVWAGRAHRDRIAAISWRH